MSRSNTTSIATSNGLGENQACTLFGAESGSSTISGSNYVSVGFGMDVADLWRRCFVVLLGFVILFQVTQVIALEYFPVSVVSSLVLLLV
jgi:ATP-binding cassette, subfamily G (WHITE), member 2, SNQ2